MLEVLHVLEALRAMKDLEAPEVWEAVTILDA